MLCSVELIKNYLNICPSDFISRVLAGEDVDGIVYSRRNYKSHNYVSFSYVYNQRNYSMDISCNILSGYFTTVDNRVCTKQLMYENIFAYDKSYVLVIAKEYFMLTTENNNPSLTDLFYTPDERKDISKYLDIVRQVGLKVKFGRFDFSLLWELESSSGESNWSDLEITTSSELASNLNHTCEIWTHIHTCKYPILVNGGKIVDKLNHHRNEVIWGLKVIYAGNLITSELTINRVELLYDLGIDVSKITTSCIDFINGVSGVMNVEFTDSKAFVNVS